MTEIEELNADIIDDEIYSLLDKRLNEDPSDGDIDRAASDLFEVIGRLIDDGDIEDTPAEDADQNEKEAWVSKYIPIIKDALKEE